MIIRDCTISSNGGTGVHSNGSNLEIYDSNITGNSSTGITLYNSSSNSRVQNCQIIDNGYHGLEGSGFEVIDSSFVRNAGWEVTGYDCTVEGCLFTQSANGIHSPYNSVTIINNTFEGEGYSSSGISVQGYGTISHNAVSGFSTGINVSNFDEVTIQNNLITGNYTGLKFESVDPQNLICTDNNIYGNRDWNVYNNTKQRVAITDSFWGTDNENVIKNKIFDYFRDSSKGPVSYTGFKSSLVDGATSSKRIAVMPYDRQSLGFVDEIIIEWTAYDPDGLLESFNLYFGETETSGVYADDAVSPVIIPVDHTKTYYSKIEGFNNQDTLETESYTSELYTGLTRVFGGSSSDEGLGVVETSDCGLVVTGYTSSFGNDYQVYLLKTDSNGNFLWEKNFGGSDFDHGTSVVETADGGLVIIGSSQSFGNRSQVYLLKTDSDGNLLWEKNFGGSDLDYGESVVEATDGGLVIIGFTESFGDSVYMIWTDSEGNGISEPGW